MLEKRRLILRPRPVTETGWKRNAYPSSPRKKVKHAAASLTNSAFEADPFYPEMPDIADDTPVDSASEFRQLFRYLIGQPTMWRVSPPIPEEKSAIGMASQRLLLLRRPSSC